MRTLWLMPDEQTYLKLSELIIDLSTTHQTPSFEPHVTLLSGIEDKAKTALAKTEALAAALRPIQASLTNIEYLEYYYKCLFFRTDDSQSIFEARYEAEEMFEHTPIDPFIPHISFLYGALPVFDKKAIIAALGNDFFVNFRMTKLRLVETSLTPEHWRVLGEFELT